MIASAMLLGIYATAPASAAPLGDGTYLTDMSTSSPQGLGPRNGVSLSYPANPIQLSWRPVAGAATYDVQLARNSSATANCGGSAAFQADNIVITKNIDQTTWVPTLGSPEDGDSIWTGTYCWRVRAAGTTPGRWSTGSRFTRTWSSTPAGLRFYNDHDGPIPRAATNTDFATGSATTRNAGYLSWNAVPGAATYEVEVGTSQSFSDSSVIVSRDNIRDSRVNLVHLPDDTYYWRVRAIAPNGSEGGWSAGSSNNFTVRWEDPSWSSAARLHPTDSSDVSDVRIGWTPMPGASYYEYQMGSNAGCFWDPETPTMAPDTYGSWVNYPAVYNDSVGEAEATLRYTSPPFSTHCRLSPIGATTLNNWVTLQNLWDPAVVTNIGNSCLDDKGKVLCERAALPDDQPDDRPTKWLGTAMAPGEEDGDAYSISWRVRPVYELDPAVESGWTVARALKVYGSWTKYRDGGANREFRFDLSLRDAAGASTVATNSTGTRCDNPTGNPTGNRCLVHIGSALEAGRAVGSVSSVSMQVPVLTWSAFPGRSGSSVPGGYLVQIARDPLFNNVAKSEYVPATKSIGYGWQQSYALTDSLPDNSEGTGYWWRVVPCESLMASATEMTNCATFYSPDSAGVPTSVASNGYGDMAVAQTFSKRTEMQVAVVPHFEGSAPLIRWTAGGVAAADHASWARGLSGAERYEVNLARDPFMNKDKISLTTSLPRIVPLIPGAGADSPSSELPDGLWYFQVRAVDRNDVAGSWSDVASFNKRVAAPELSVRGGGAGAGPGVIVTWSSIVGAAKYDVQWSKDPTFSGTPSESFTRQTSFRIPSTEAGRIFWRVRAEVNGIGGAWSPVSQAGPYVTIQPATRIRYSLSRAQSTAGTTVMLDGELLVAGKPRSGKTLQLMRKVRGCDVAGAYVASGKEITGRRAEQGRVRFAVRAVQNGCYRLSWKGPDGVHLSAPIAVKVAPRLGLVIAKSAVRRGAPICAAVTSNRPITGRLRFQFRSSGAWQRAREVKVTAMTARRQCFAINAAGTMDVRVVADQMRHRTERWRQYEDARSRTADVRVNDAWEIR